MIPQIDLTRQHAALRAELLPPAPPPAPPADMDPLVAIARRRGLAVVEDAAQAIGAAYAGRPVGSFGDLTCLSFYPTKNLGACGAAGMAGTDREERAERVRRLRDHGSREKYQHAELGYSSRLDELQAALLRVKLHHLPGWTAARRRLAARYSTLLAGLPLALPRERPPALPVYHPYTVRSPQGDPPAPALAPPPPPPPPPPGQPLFRSGGALPTEAECPHAWQASREVLSLPCFPELTDAEIDAVAHAVRQALSQIEENGGEEG